MPRPRLNILIVEDSSDEITLQELLLRRSGVTDPVHFVRNGNEAIQFLQKAETSNEEVCSTLLILDLNMPGMGGLELLQWLRSNPVRSLLGKIVLTSSSDPEQITQAYLLGAAGVFRKPASLDQAGNLFRRIYEYWSVAESSGQNT